LVIAFSVSATVTRYLQHLIGIIDVAWALAVLANTLWQLVAGTGASEKNPDPAAKFAGLEKRAVGLRGSAMSISRLSAADSTTP